MLTYQEVEYGVISGGLRITSQPGPFKREPDCGQRKVRRGRLSWRELPAQAVPFLWDQTPWKLYLDLNRNEDLTDDPAGVFSGASKPAVGTKQQFTNIHLAFATEAGRHPVLVDLDLWAYREHFQAVATMRSFWAGLISLHGRDWQVGFIESPEGRIGLARHGHLLVRPWAARQEQFNVQSGTLDALEFPDKLFVQGQAYRVECQYERQEDQPQYRLKLTQQRVPLGELKLTGEFVRRLVLKDGSYTVVVDAPAGTVPVPMGNYSAYQVQVQKGDVIALADTALAREGIKTRLVVASNPPATLTAGGPLTNIVTLTRWGRSLVLNQRLVGAGGTTYRFPNRDRRQPPRFTVYQGDQQLGSGQFEYG